MFRLKTKSSPLGSPHVKDGLHVGTNSGSLGYIGLASEGVPHSGTVEVEVGEVTIEMEAEAVLEALALAAMWLQQFSSLPGKQFSHGFPTFTQAHHEQELELLHLQHATTRQAAIFTTHPPRTC